MSTIPDPTTTEWVPIWNPNAGQTPWISNIDGGGFNLTNAEYLFAQDVICGYKDFNSTGPATLMGPGTFTWYGPAGNFSSRWNMVLNGAESGANAGSNFWIYRYNDDGSPIGPAITINRATGVMDFVVQPTVNGGPITVPQTPWVSDIDGGGWSLTNANIGKFGGYLQAGPDTGNALLLLPSNRAIEFYAAGPLARWYMTGAWGNETGGNAGGNFGLFSYDDGGVFLRTAYIINRNTGIVDFTQVPTIGGASLITVAQTPWLSDIDGNAHSLANVDGITVNNILANVDIAAKNSLRVGYSASSLFLIPTGVEFQATGGLPRWLLTDNYGTEDGSNSGTGFALFRYADDGSYLDYSLIIARDTGKWLLNGNLQTKNLGIGLYPGPVATFASYAATDATYSGAYLVISNNMSNGNGYGFWQIEQAATGQAAMLFQNDLNHQFIFILGGSNHANGYYRDNSMFLFPGDLVFNSNTSGEVLRVAKASGNIGVGNTLPAYKLDVAGDVNATGAYRQNAVAFYSGGNLIVAANATIAAGLSVGKTTAPNFAVDVVGDVNCSGAFRINGVVHAGRAGIAPPLAPLHVSGQAQLPGWSAIFDDPSSPEWLLIGASSGVPAIQGSDPDGNTSPITLNPLGNNVGVNTVVPAYPLDVVGDVNCTGKVRVNGVPLAPFVTVISYRGDTSTTQMSDPGTGLMRWSAPAAADTTELAFDRLTTDNNIDATLMWVVANPVRLLIQDAELALNFQYWTITGPLISQADWFRIPVRFESGGGTGADMFAPKPKPIRLIVYLLNY